MTLFSNEKNTNNFTAIKKFLLQKETIYILCISLIPLITHILTSLQGNYGYYIDEFYYLACSKKLAFGYVDHPPLSLFILFIWRNIFGESIFSLRFLPAMTHTAIIVFTGLITKKLGGKLLSIILSTVSVIAMPILFGMSNFYSMNPFEILIWTICIYILIKIFTDDNPKLWIAFGIFAGLGVENKHTTLFFIISIILGLLLTKKRKYFLNKWFWIGFASAIILIVPNFLWQIKNGFPTLEFYLNASGGKYVKYMPHDVFLNIMINYNPGIMHIWIMGIVYFFIDKEKKGNRVFAWSAVFLFLFLFLTKSSRPDRIAGIFPLLVSGGSILFIKLIWRKYLKWIASVTIIATALSIIIISPLAIPVLKPDLFIKYNKIIGIGPKQAEHNNESKFPMYYANRFGWEETVKSTAAAYNSLTEDEKKNAFIFGNSYGHAGALDLFGQKYNLPEAYSGHNNYFLWGPPENSAQIVISAGISKGVLSQYFEEITVFEIIYTEYAPAWRKNTTILIGRKPKKDIKENWDKIKFYY